VPDRCGQAQRRNAEIGVCESPARELPAAPVALFPSQLADSFSRPPKPQPHRNQHQHPIVALFPGDRFVQVEKDSSLSPAV